MMSEDDQVATALFACQRHLRPLTSLYRTAIANAVLKDQEFKAPEKPIHAQAISGYQGNLGWDESLGRSSTSLRKCREVLAPLSHEAKERVRRGLMTWLLHTPDYEDHDELAQAEPY